MFLQNSICVLCGLPRVIAVVIFDNSVVRYAVRFQIMPHNGWLVVTFLSSTAANQNQFKVTLPIERNGMIQPSLQHLRRIAVRLHLISKHNRKIGGMKIVT